MAKSASAKPKIAIACQGGGSQTAFTAGVLKALIDREIGQRFEVVSISGTSGGAVCATLVWFAICNGDRPLWRRLIDFWNENTAISPVERAFNDAIIQSMRMINSGLLPAFQLSPSSPYVKSLLSWAKLGCRDEFTNFPAVLRKHIDFDRIASWGPRSQRPVLVI